ncbi:hypothetical protein DL96DRAFT_1626872 [Flagelloscypha sp. PMI_526]|nr:hypothetical protein DL96DRAFT_1626872 [Flagelloscypha sp. PMI_526]
MTQTVTLSEQALSFTYTDSDYNLRFICINRRGYAGSSDYSAEETLSFDGDENNKSDLLRVQGLYLVLAIDRLMFELDLPSEAGMALCGWSLGYLFTLAILDALNSDLVSEIPKRRVQEFMKCVILYDPSVSTLGLPLPEGVTGYHPLLDPSIHERAKNLAFGIWIASYFDHDESLPHEFSKLKMKETMKDPPPTNSTFVYEDFIRLATVSKELHAIEVKLKPPTSDLTNLRELYVEGNYSGLKRHVLYGSRSAWSCVYAAWLMSDCEGLNIKRLDCANHFMMWDDPAGFLSSIKECISDI